MPPPSTAQQKVFIAQFVSLTGASERQATRVSHDMRSSRRLSVCPEPILQPSRTKPRPQILLLSARGTPSSSAAWHEALG